MKFPQVLLMSVLATFCGTADRALSETTIVVNVGPHSSAEVAGSAEAEVNWLDADPADDTVSTECFAAMELQHFLRKMTDRGTDFTIVDDDRPTTGDLILLGGLESIPGTIAGGLIIGLSQGLVAAAKAPVVRNSAEIMPYVVLLIVLIFRPEGLFGQKRIERI